jgi:hypothetical protein
MSPRVTWFSQHGRKLASSQGGRLTGCGVWVRQLQASTIGEGAYRRWAGVHTESDSEEELDALCQKGSTRSEVVSHTNRRDLVYLC